LRSYQAKNAALLWRRAERLVAAFLRSVESQPSVFIAHVDAVAEARMAEGVFLHEMQMALQILEETAWRLVVESAVPAEQIRCLGQVTCVIGAAKDRLAQLYLQRLERAESAARGADHGGAGRRCREEIS
jgi:hypothetical protein